MSAVTIFVEGKADQNFIEALIENHFEQPKELNVDIKSFGGKDKWQEARPDFLKSTSKGRANLLIFDADEQPANRKNEIEEKRRELEIEFDFFLFPNDSASGELENLLVELMSEKAASILDCFESYKECLDQIDGAITKSDLKTNLYVYSQVLTGIGGETIRSYRNQEVWNLQSEALTPLLNFLKRHLEDES